MKGEFMKITQKQLKRLIREEYLRSSLPTSPGQMMTEARANMIAEQMLEEGLFDVVKAGFKGLTAAGGAVAQKLGDAASKSFGSVGKALQQVASQAKTAYDSVAKAVGEIKDTAVKSAAEAAKKSLEDSLTATMKKELATTVAALTKAGMKEEEAKTLAASIASGAAAKLTGSG